jgi:two-component system sensor histidine kinase TctE
MLLAFVGLLVILEIIVGASAQWIVHQNIDTGSNRVLLGSLKTISVAFAEPEPMRSKVMPIALKLLRRRARPVTHYSIYHNGQFVAGYPELKPPRGDEPEINVRSILGTPIEGLSEYVDSGDAVAVVKRAYIRKGSFQGQPVRIATEIRHVPGFEHPVVIQIAIWESVLNVEEHNSLKYILMAASAALLIAVVIYWRATKWAVRPFMELQSQVEARGSASEFRFTSLPAAPQEAATFISAFNTLLAELRESALAVKRFTSEASHQMRTPLAVLRTHLDLVRRYGVRSNIGQDGLADMDGAIGTLERLLLQLISLARAEEWSGQVQLREPFDLVAAVASAAADHFDQAHERNIDLSFDRPEEDPMLASGHGILARELVSNLIDNAVRYNKAGGSVIVRVSRQGSACRMEVIDDGPGIPQEARTMVFDRFYRLPRDGDQHGSGLGLPIVRALAERMSATVVLGEGAEDRGLRVMVDFRPATAADRLASSRQSEQRAA